jgi:orotidine-5'-phosphate decarboxylase
MTTYSARLSARIASTRSHLCVGLDPRADLIPGDWVDFFARVIDETAPFTAAYKPNIAYFEALGSGGIATLEKVLARIPREVPVILDAKRSDIPETMKAYAKAYFEHWSVDAVTLNPLLGFDSIEPFLQYPGKGVYLLAITSNPGAADIELRQAEGRYFFEHVQDMAGKAAALPGSVGLVVGLTNIRDELLNRVADLPLLVPGFGAQGGDPSRLKIARRTAPILINASRSILYANPEKSFAVKAREAVAQINAAMGASAGPA